MAWSVKRYADASSLQNAEIRETTLATTKFLLQHGKVHDQQTSTRVLILHTALMCGIYFSYCRDKHDPPSKELQDALQRRGPDSVNSIQRSIESSDTNTGHGSPGRNQTHYLTFLSTVLALRGDSIVQQPIVNQNSGSLLCWNGEAWSIDNGTVQGNDAAIVFDLFQKATQHAACSVDDGTNTGDHSMQHMIKAIESITGPYAFVFYDALHHRVYYGRDPLGRRSLAIRNNLPDSLIISSICDPTDPQGWEEVEADGINIINLVVPSISNHIAGADIVHVARVPNPAMCAWPLTLISPFTSFNARVDRDTAFRLSISSSAVSDLDQNLRKSLEMRLKGVPLPPYPLSSHTRVAVLFSGGLDCTVLARLAHDILPQNQEIDLLNVAFENPRVVQAAAKRSVEQPVPISSAYASCPDRVTGLSSYVELEKVCPGRTWRFVSVDVPYRALMAHRPGIVSLIYPHNTEMDLSIACALYFAARGSGTLIDAMGRAKGIYTTPARVLLSGLGADELFGGYTRHATAFDRRGCKGLSDELQMDFNRLGKRNLGRDDRVISHWGREVRYPYLDEAVVDWALSIPVWEKCGFGEYEDTENGDSPKLEPAKKILRMLAWKLGLRNAASEKKRAIQFGARTAKMEAGRTRGTDTVL